MSDCERALFLSVRPRFANGILNGTKTTELRRTTPRLGHESLVVLYASSPISAVVGVFQLSDICTGAPTEIWRVLGPTTGVNILEFNKYFEEAGRGTALMVGRTWRVLEPTKLETLRTHWPSFHPPQGYRYVSAAIDDKTLRVRLNGSEISLPITKSTARFAGSPAQHPQPGA